MGRLLAAMCSGVVSRSAVAPLERIKIDHMLHHSRTGIAASAQRIFQTEGFLGFWRGNGLNLLRSVPFKALNYISFDTYWRWLKSRTGSEGPSSHMVRFIAGAMAGITAATVFFPLDSLRTRLLAPHGSKYRNPMSAAVRMAREEGFRSLYQGLSPTLLALAPNNAVFFATYHLLKVRHLPSDSTDSAQLRLPPHLSLFYGGVAGVCAEAVTYPFEVVRRHLQLQVMPPSGARGIVPAFQHIFAKEGLAGFYRGVLPGLLQVLPSAALSYSTCAPFFLSFFFFFPDDLSQIFNAHCVWQWVQV